MSLVPGTRLGPYEVLAPLGDGTEDRYKATDTRLNRVVTLKAAPTGRVGASRDQSEARARFQVISSLGHPQICAPSMSAIRIRQRTSSSPRTSRARRCPAARARPARHDGSRSRVGTRSPTRSTRRTGRASRMAG